MPIDVINSVNNDEANEMEELPDFQNFNEDECLLDVFNLSNDELEAFYEEETVQWYPTNSPLGKLGIKVNELGQVRSTNPEVHLVEGKDARVKISIYNKALGGKLYTVFVYSAGKQKIYDCELGMEVFKLSIQSTLHTS